MTEDNQTNKRMKLLKQTNGGSNAWHDALSADRPSNLRTAIAFGSETIAEPNSNGCWS